MIRPIRSIVNNKIQDSFTQWAKRPIRAAISKLTLSSFIRNGTSHGRRLTQWRSEYLHCTSTEMFDWTLRFNFWLPLEVLQSGRLCVVLKHEQKDWRWPRIWCNQIGTVCTRVASDAASRLCVWRSLADREGIQHLLYLFASMLSFLC